MTATQTCTALATDRIDFVDEDDCSTHLACLLEQVSYAGRTNTDEHLHEVRARYGKETDAGLTGNCARKQRLAGAWRTDE